MDSKNQTDRNSKVGQTIINQEKVDGSKKDNMKNRM